MSSQQRRVFSKNPIFVIIVSNEEGELKRLYYNVMFCKRADIAERMPRSDVAHIALLSDPSPIIGHACHSLPNWLTHSLTPV